MTFDQYVKAHAPNAKTKMSVATGISLPTLRKVERRMPIRLDVAWLLAEFLLGDDADPCDVMDMARVLTKPKPRRVRAKVTKRRPV